MCNAQHRAHDRRAYRSAPTGCRQAQARCGPVRAHPMRFSSSSIPRRRPRCDRAWCSIRTASCHWPRDRRHPRSCRLALRSASENSLRAAHAGPPRWRHRRLLLTAGTAHCVSCRRYRGAKRHTTACPFPARCPATPDDLFHCRPPPQQTNTCDSPPPRCRRHCPSHACRRKSRASCRSDRRSPRRRIHPTAHSCRPYRPVRPR